jgi:hypothetical protein
MKKRVDPDADPASLASLVQHGLRKHSDGGFVRKLDPAPYQPKTSNDPENRRSFDRASWAARGETAL